MKKKEEEERKRKEIAARERQRKIEKGLISEDDPDEEEEGNILYTKKFLVRSLEGGSEPFPRHPVCSGECCKLSLSGIWDRVTEKVGLVHFGVQKIVISNFCPQ